MFPDDEFNHNRTPEDEASELNLDLIASLTNYHLAFQSKLSVIQSNSYFNELLEALFLETSLFMSQQILETFCNPVFQNYTLDKFVDELYEDFLEEDESTLTLINKVKDAVKYPNSHKAFGFLDVYDYLIESFQEQTFDIGRCKDIIEENMFYLNSIYPIETLNKLVQLELIFLSKLFDTESDFFINVKHAYKSV